MIPNIIGISQLRKTTTGKVFMECLGCGKRHHVESKDNFQHDGSCERPEVVEYDSMKHLRGFDFSKIDPNIICGGGNYIENSIRF